MSRTVFAVRSVSALLVSTVPAAGFRSTPADGSYARRTLLQMPLRFETNAGQTDAGVKFVAREPSYMMLLGAREVVPNLRGGSSPAATAKGVKRLGGVGNYLTGNDESKWLTGVPSGAEVKGLGDVKATFDNIEAFMKYASAMQLNVLAPYRISGTTNAAARESYVEFWATGQGLVTPESTDGAVIQDGAWPVDVTVAIKPKPQKEGRTHHATSKGPVGLGSCMPSACFSSACKERRESLP